MPAKAENVEKLRSQRKVARSAITRNINRVRELISNKHSVSKVRQYSKSIEEARDKARTVITELENANPSSIEANGEWLLEAECDVTEVLGGIADYLESNQPEPKSPSISGEEQSPESSSATMLVVSTQNSHSGGLKGVKIPVFDGSWDKWGIFSSVVDSNKSLSDAIKLAHLNNSINNKVREVIACLTEEPGEAYQKRWGSLPKGS